VAASQKPVVHLGQREACAELRSLAAVAFTAEPLPAIILNESFDTFCSHNRKLRTIFKTPAVT